ncbi:MAG: hypothetical protein QM820_09290 [Minicystis sp.]
MKNAASITALSLVATLSSYAACEARAAASECDHLVRTSVRTISVDAEQPGGAAAHGGHVQAHIAAANARCATLGWSSMIVTFADGEGFCAYPGEEIESTDTVTCDTACRYVVVTSVRTIDVDAQLPGGAAAHGGYVSAHLADANARCRSSGWSSMIVMFTDGEGYCAYPGERLTNAGGGACAATCDYRVETTERTLDVDQAIPGGAAAHGGRVIPHLAPANARCLADGWATMIVTFADGEGLCAYPGERLTGEAPVSCDTAMCNYLVETTMRSIDVNQGHPEGAGAHGGFVTPHLAPANARCSALGWTSMIATFTDGEGYCAYEGEAVVSSEAGAC